MDASASVISIDCKTLPSHWDFSCDFEVDYESEENAQIVYSALAVDKELKQDFFAHHLVLSWMFLRSPQKQLKNLVKEWNYDALCNTV